MKIFIISFFLTLSVFSGVKEDMERVRNEIQLELTKERLKLIKANVELTTQFNNILRTHEKLERILKRHPELIKNEKLKEPDLTKLKLKIMKEDEDIRELKGILTKMHRKLEEELQKNKSIANLQRRLTSIESRLKLLQK